MNRDINVFFEDAQKNAQFFSTYNDHPIDDYYCNF